MAKSSPVSEHRFERVLAYMVAASIAVSIAAFVAMIVATSLGERTFDGIWPTIVMLPYFGLPIGFVLMIVLLIMSAIRRGRETKDARG